MGAGVQFKADQAVKAKLGKFDTPSLLSQFQSAYKYKPATSTSSTKSSSKTESSTYIDTANIVKQNLAATPDALNIASQVNAANVTEQDKSLSAVMPGYKDLLAKGMATASDMLSGNIPADVVAQIKRNMAEQSLSGGFSGSQRASYLTARDLGLTSLSLIEKGSSAAQEWLKTGSSLAAPLYDVSQQFMTPTWGTSSSGTSKSESSSTNTEGYYPNMGQQQYLNYKTGLQGLSSGSGGSSGGGRINASAPTSTGATGLASPGSYY